MARHILLALAVVLVTPYAQAASVIDIKRAQLQTQASAGDLEAQYQLGRSYCCGRGPGHSTTKALHWFCQAGLAGHRGAQFKLGQLYGIRTFVKHRAMSIHRPYAYMWYTLAADQGDERAEAYRAALAQDMTDAQIARAEAWAEDPAQVGCGGSTPD